MTGVHSGTGRGDRWPSANVPLIVTRAVSRRPGADVPGRRAGAAPADQCRFVLVARVMSTAALTFGSPSVWVPERSRPDQWS
ncbi:hypothetical protein MCAG_01016 [Micromonospora sp. ATCC 39149]|nr:hypothetical protein MCAG_01016 [Micromonospora sp. ATCC 39149]